MITLPLEYDDASMSYTVKVYAPNQKETWDTVELPFRFEKLACDQLWRPDCANRCSAGNRTTLGPCFPDRSSSLPDSYSLSLGTKPTDPPFLVVNGVDTDRIAASQLVPVDLPKFKSWGDKVWSTSISAMQFDDEEPMIPCDPVAYKNDKERCSVKLTGDEALELHDAVFQMFVAKYIKPDGSCKDERMHRLRGDTEDAGPFDCQDTIRLPRLAMGLGNARIVLNPDDYVTKNPTTQRVSVHIRRAGTMATQLGLPFLRKYYTSINITSEQYTMYCEDSVTCEIGQRWVVVNESQATLTPNGPGHHAAPSSEGVVLILALCIVGLALLSCLVAYWRRQRCQQEPTIDEEPDKLSDTCSTDADKPRSTTTTTVGSDAD